MNIYRVFDNTPNGYDDIWTMADRFGAGTVYTHRARSGRWVVKYGNVSPDAVSDLWSRAVHDLVPAGTDMNPPF